MIQQSHGANGRRLAALTGGPRWRRLVATTVAASLALSGVGSLAIAPSAQAATAKPPTLIYAEDFENSPNGSNVLLDAYTGDGGMTYTADPIWLSRPNCNGFIVDSTSVAEVGDCTALGQQVAAFGALKHLAEVLGQVGGSADPTHNAAVAAFTEADPGAGLREFETVSAITVPTPNRFITFSVDAVASACNVAHPALQFKVGGTNIGSALDPCTGDDYAGIKGGRFTSNGSVLVPGTSLKVTMVNNQGSGNGNDAAFDNIRVLDVTPSLTKSFSPARVGVGQVADLKFTVTNTTEKASKSGWFFNDNLTTGLTRADDFMSHTCDTAPTVTGGAGATSVRVTGDLVTDEAECSVTIHVVSSLEDVIGNGPSNIDPFSGVIPPADDVSLNVVNPMLQVKTAFGDQRVAATDQYQVEIADGGSVVATSTSTGSGSTVDAGTGATAAYEGRVKPYTFRESATGTAAGRYGTKVTCVDAKGYQDGLPTNQAATSVSITPEAGSDITCTFTNTPLVNAMTLDKQVEPLTDLDGDGLYDVGDTINYSFVVKNTGETVLSNVAVADPSLGAVTCPVTTLNPGGSTVCTQSAGHVVVQDDMDAGEYRNTATLSANEPGGLPVTPVSDTETVAVPGTADLALDKQVAGSPVDTNNNSKLDAGDTISWRFVLTNTGTLSLRNPVVSDPMLNALGISVTCPTGKIAPGASVTCTSGAFTIPQAAMDNPSVPAIVNTASASATDPQNNAESSAADTTTTTLDKVSSLSLTKSVSPTTVASAGDQVTYTFKVKNTGTLSVANLSIDESSFRGTGTVGTPTCGATSLAPGAETTCTMDYSATQADVDASAVENTATAKGTDSLNAQVTSNSSSASFTTVASSGLRLVKSATVNDVNADSIRNLGDTISYHFEVTNTGNQTVSAVSISDSLLTGIAITCPAGPLAPGAKVTCEADSAYQITQAELDAGNVRNVATATAASPSGPVASPSVTLDTSLAAANGLKLAKSGTLNDANSDGVTNVGDTISYHFEVTNTGNQTVSAVSVADPMLGAIAITCPAGGVAPGAKVTCDAQTGYSITQAELDAGTVHNEATAAAKIPGGGTVASPAGSSDNALTAANGLSITKTGTLNDANNDSIANVGDTITYHFKVKNTGNQTVSAVSVDDPMLAGITITCPAGALAPGATVNCAAQADYQVTQANVDAGKAHNDATAAATVPGGGPVTSAAAGVDTLLPGAASLKVTPSGTLNDVNADGVANLGDTISYSFVVKNTGNVTMAAPSINDPMLTAKGITVTCPAGPIPPGGSLTCTSNAGYPVTQSELDAGQVLNAASAAATDPSGAPVTSPVGNAATALPAATGLALVKLGTVTDANHDGMTNARDTISYHFEVTNTGNQTVSAVSVADPMLTGITITCPAGDLAPGAKVTCDAETGYSITQANVDAGKVHNVATASATAPAAPGARAGGVTVTSNAGALDTPLPPANGLSITKTGTLNDANNDRVANVGDTITYQFKVKNTGNQTLSAVSVDDPMLGAIAITCPAGDLAPGDTATCDPADDYEITQANVDAGNAHNDATAAAKAPGGEPVTSQAGSADTSLPGAASLKVTPSGALNDVNTDGVANLGDTISYSFVVKNTGNVTMAAPSIDDPMLAARGITVTCPAGPIAPGDSLTCNSSAGYAVTQADLDAGNVHNLATASANDPSGAPVASAQASEDTALTAAPGLALTVAGAYADANGDSVNNAGDTITYTFKVTNTGNVTISLRAIDDPLLAAADIVVICPAGGLAPGATVTCDAETALVLKQSDVDAGGVHNVATVSGRSPADRVVKSPSSSFDTPLVGAPKLSLKKSAAYHDVNDNQRADAGDTITYTFKVTNTGNKTVAAPTIVDPLLVSAGIGVTCDAGTVAPSAVVDCFADADYVITLADVEAGGVHNEATATTGDGKDKVTSQLDPVEVPLKARPGLSLKKSGDLVDANGNGRTDLGDLIYYQFLITNTGNVTVKKLVVTDKMLAKAGIGITCPAEGVAPGTSVTCTANAGYAITKEDVAAGHVSNTATVAGEGIGPAVAGVEDTVDTQLSNLAFTGSDLTVAGLAGVALVAGAVLLVVARRRRSEGTAA